MKSRQQFVLAFARGLVPALFHPDIGLGPRHQLARGCLLHVERFGNLLIGLAEDFVQQVGRPLLRRQPLQHQEEGGGERRGKRQLLLGIVLACRVDRLRQPCADIVDALAVRRLQKVEAAAGARRRQPGGRRFDRLLIGLLPFDERVLHRVFRVCARTEDPVGEAEEPRPGLFEDIDTVLSTHLSASDMVHTADGRDRC